MKIRFWGTRGSVATPDPEMAIHGGNTSCVEVLGAGGERIVIDAGTGIRRLGATMLHGDERIDILLSHLHLDHIQGLGFFKPLFQRGREVHIWGPAGAGMSLDDRLARYLSPPLFPVRLRDLPCALETHALNRGSFDLGGVRVTADRVCHPDPTLGYRLEEDGRVFAYLSDHEPALGSDTVPTDREWLSGHDLAEGADVLVHDSQYTAAEYPNHVGWGHSSMNHAVQFAARVGARQLVAFHHDPTRTDLALERELADVIAACNPSFSVIAAAEGMEIELGG